MTNENRQCKVQGCNGSQNRIITGYCLMHYNRVLKTGNPGTPWKKGHSPVRCVVEGCETHAGPTGACRRHWHTVNSPKDRGRKSKYARTYGITLEDYDRMLEEQGGRCKICPATEGSGRTKYFSIDHDHSCCPGPTACGQCIRGLLCSRCNLILGQVNDDPALLQRMAEYVTPRRQAGV